jgi:complement component 1 Q subcomponent-binding protein, mitochondrial
VSFSSAVSSPHTRLTRITNCSITVSFSISDLANYEPDLYNEDEALGDEFDGASSQQRGTPEEAAEEGLEEDADAAPPCRLNVVVEKEGVKGVLNIEAVAQDGQIMVENFSYYDDAALAHSTNAEATHKAQDAYPGPPFGTLDEDLQVLMERYLEERGVTDAFAIFVPDYMDLKEQREYQQWLKNVKTFVDV